MTRMTSILAALVIALPSAAFAMGFGNSDSSESGDPVSYDMGYKNAMEGQYSKAIEVLKVVVKDSPDNADAWNMLGFSYRSISDFNNAWDAYERALTIDPAHRGAHEYVGEWYLSQGDLASAEAQLKKLAALCPEGCPEHDTLEASLEKARSGS